MTTDCKDCKIGKERGCEGCEQDHANFDYIVGMNDDRFIAKINTAE